MNVSANSSVRSEAAVSFDPRASAPARPQDREKFVSRYSVRPLASKELETRVALLEETFASNSKQLAEIASQVQWSCVSVDALKAFSDPLRDLTVECNGLTSALYGTDGLVAYAACSAPNGRMPLIARLHKVAIGIVFNTKQIADLQAAKQNPQFISAYSRLKADLASMFDLSCVEKLDAFLLKVDAMIGEFSKASHPLATQLLRICCFVLEKQGNNQREVEVRKRSAQLAHLLERANPEVLELSDEYAKSSSDEYTYWKRSPLGSEPAYRLPYLGVHAFTGSLGDSLTAAIGKPLGGLIVILRELVTGYAQGRPYVNTDEYARALGTLEKLYKDKLRKVCTTPPDKLTVSLIAYVIGLGYAFEEARYYLDLARQCTDYHLFEAQTALQNYTRQNGLSGLFILLKKMKEAKDEMPSKHSKEPLDQFVRNATLLLYDIHAKQASEELQLTEQEKEVPKLVFSGVATEHLESYVAKRILQLLFLPFCDFDIELEMVLHVAAPKLSPQFIQSDIYKAYVVKKLSLADLRLAVKMVRRIIEAFDKDAFAYLRAWQKFLEQFQKKDADLYFTMVSWLERAEEQHQYGALYPEVYQSGLDSWHVQEPELFLQELHTAITAVDSKIPGSTDKEKTQNLFQSILLRTIGAQIFAKNPRECHFAQGVLHALMTKPEYVVFTVGEAFDPILLESALLAILRTPSRYPPLSVREKRLVGAAIDTYLAHGGSKKVELVTFALAEQEPELKTRCIDAMGEFDFMRLRTANNALPRYWVNISGHI